MTRVKEELAPGISYVDHGADDVLLWMTDTGERQPFDSTRRLWTWCIDELVKAGHVERTGDGLSAVKVTDAGYKHAAILRGDG